MGFKNLIGKKSKPKTIVKAKPSSKDNPTNGKINIDKEGFKKSFNAVIFTPEKANELMDIVDSIDRSNEKTINGKNLLFNYHLSDGFKWLRFNFLCGSGIHVKDINKHKPLFSERNGYQKFITIGKWRFKFLKPNKKLKL